MHLGFKAFLMSGLSLAIVSPVIAQEESGSAPVEDASDSPIIIADRLDPVQIYGDRGRYSPGAISIIDDDEISRVRADHPADLLNALPGVKVEENSGQESLISIRSPVLTGGAGQGSFLILTNGVPNRASAFGNVNMLMESHFELAQAVEVVRGPGSAKYGSNAIHGLVNVILQDVFEDPTLTVSGSTLSRYRLDGVSPIRDGAVGLSVQKDLGWRASSGVEQVKFSATQQFWLGDWSGDAFVVGTWLDQQTAGFIQGDRAYEDADLSRSNPNPDAFREAAWAMAAVKLQYSLGIGDLSITPYLRGQAMQFSQHFLPYDGTEDNAHGSLGVMSRFDVWALAGDWSFGLDADYARGWLKEVQDRPSFGPFPQGVHYDYAVETTVGAAWTQVEYELGRDWELVAGVRAEAHRYDYATDAPTGVNGRFLVVPDRSDEFAFVTPKLGVLRRGETVDVFANYARGARAPQASDLYRLQSQQTGPSAEVETLDSLEVGVRGFAFDDAVNYQIAAYGMEKRGFFFRDADGLNVPDGRTDHFGIEATWRWQPVYQLVISGSLSWSDQTYAFDRIVARGGETIRSGAQIDTAPEWLADVSLDWDPDGPFRLGLSGEYVGEYFTDAENTARYPGHVVFNARGAYDVGERLEVFAIVRNLFDTRYASRADFAFGSDRYFPGEPLNLTVGLTLRYD